MANPLPIALLTLLFSLPISSSAAVIDVFFLSGQSNASGRNSTGLSLPDLRDAQVQYYYRTDGPWDNDQTSGGNFTTLQPLPTGFYGPEMTLGRGLVDLGYNPAIIKVSDGGQSLADGWNSSGAGGTWWNHWKSDVADALSDLAGGGDTVNLRGFLWMQGESDANDVGRANAYQSNFETFTTDVYSYLNGLGYDASGMQFVTALIDDDLAGSDYEATVRAAQQAVMNNLSPGSCFDTKDLSQQGDNLHFDAAGSQAVGDLFAASIASSVPEPSSLSMIGLAAVLTVLSRKP